MGDGEYFTIFIMTSLKVNCGKISQFRSNSGTKIHLFCSDFLANKLLLILGSVKNLNRDRININELEFKVIIQIFTYHIFSQRNERRVQPVRQSWRQQHRGQPDWRCYESFRHQPHQRKFTRF